MSAILTAEHVTKSYPVPGGEMVAIRNLSLDIAEGEFLCLLGASGCGKSTMLNMFAGFTAPTTGRVLLQGRPITGIEPRCGMVFQSYALFPWKTVQENIEFPLRMRDVPRSERRAIASSLIEMVHLDGFADRYPGELSGGMQQRVTLARCLAADPLVMLMDEPFAALDAMTRQVMQDELLRIQERSGKTIVFITHNIDEAIILGHRIVVMSARPGRIRTIVENPLPRPRHVGVQTSHAFADLKAELWAQIEEEVMQHVAASRLAEHA
ncbi:MAG: NitT/TauT family transport system ATP-binding protein [Enterovirga sp.]|nr:NitT/TauT family transport system ATP-binding protein [Enterovirga sp.]